MLFPNASRTAVAVVLAALAVLFAPAPAGAKIIELGQTTTQPEPQCPTVSDKDQCRAVTKTTGYQVNIGSSQDVFLAPKDGRVVAWTVFLGAPTDDEMEFFEATYGGPARAGISVLEQEKKGSTVQKVVANSAVRNLTSFLGERGRRVQFPLAETLPVEKGQRVALTVPTWAPVFAEGFDPKTAWRASRSKGSAEDDSCGTPATFAMQTALLGIGASAPFQCFYKTVRLAYSVTMITEPHGPPKKKKDRPKVRESSLSGLRGG